MDEQAKLAFELAGTWARELITLSTGILAVSITFTKDVLKPQAGGVAWLGSAWVLYLLTILLGMGVLGGLTGALMPVTPPPAGTPLRFHSTIRVFASAQLISFVLGTVLIIIYGVRGLRAPPAADPGSKGVAP